MHLTAAQLFAESSPIHRSLIDPLRFSQELISVRNNLQKVNHPLALLTKVLVYRGLPSVRHDPKNYGRNLAQKASWERRSIVNVTYRPLKYPRVRDSNGIYVFGKPEEKGIDVLCALALVREAQHSEIDLVILASQDSDLVPALDEAIANRSAKIETCSWHVSGNPSSREIRPEGTAIWNTRLNENHFFNSLDRNLYS